MLATEGRPDPRTPGQSEGVVEGVIEGDRTALLHKCLVNGAVHQSATTFETCWEGSWKP